MKRGIIIGLILLVGVALLIIPLLKEDEIIESEMAAEFVAKQDNIAFRFGENTPIEINVLIKNLKKIELVYGGKVLKEWLQPEKGKLTFKYDFSKEGIGKRSLLIRTTFENGATEVTQVKNTIVLSDVPPLLKQAVIRETLAHNDTNYTQGLEFYKGELFEGTGDNQRLGNTMLGVVDLKNGGFIRRKGIGRPYFGEGITILNDKIFQITWQNGKCFVWDLGIENIIKEFNYSGEGWGLCNNGKELIMSNGTGVITFRNPETFGVVRTIQVLDNEGMYDNLNELEFIDGKIYANIYLTDNIIVIDPHTGKVLEIIDASVLRKKVLETRAGLRSDEVLNGIAFNPENKKIYLTGKNWPNMFVVSIAEKN